MAYLKALNPRCVRCMRRRATVRLYTQHGQEDHAYCRPCGEHARAELTAWEAQHTLTGRYLASVGTGYAAHAVYPTGGAV